MPRTLAGRNPVTQPTLTGTRGQIHAPQLLTNTSHLRKRLRASATENATTGLHGRRAGRSWGGAGRSAGGGLQRVAEVAGLLGRHLDHQAATALERYAHHDAPTLLGHLQGTVTGPGLHRRHLPASFVVPAVAGAPGRVRGGMLAPFSPMARTGGKPERSTPSPVRGGFTQCNRGVTPRRQLHAS